MGFNRRGFLERLGAAIAALGASDALLTRFDGAGRVLAEPTRRKLALLVGIDRYPEVATGPGGATLQGCATDVRLQKELLVGRFGFDPADIVTLTDEAATREQIEYAFVEHLQQQAKSGDVVVFHFSGYGSRTRSSELETAQNSLVPVDGVLSAEDESTVNDLLVPTLALLLRSLSTDKVLAVLDTSYLYPGTSWLGNLRVRSRPQPTLGKPSEAELAFQKELRQARKSNKLPGTVLTAAGDTQLAAEVPRRGFSAGAFTYAFTQHLWQSNPATTLRFAFKQASCNVEELAGGEQRPQLCQNSLGECDRAVDLASLSGLLLSSAPDSAEGAIVSVEEGGKSASLWLAGLPAAVLEYCAVDTVFKVELSDRDPIGLHVVSREGLTAKARIDDGAEPAPIDRGMRVREAIRAVPRNLGLTVALDGDLERIERVDATSAFSTIRQVASVAVGEPADCLFGRVGRSTLAQMSDDLPASDGSSYGLFTVGQEPIPNSISMAEEAIKKSVQRLTPQLETLQATKLVGLTENEGSSRLQVRSTLVQVEPENRILSQKIARGGDRAVSGEAPTASELEPGVVTIAAGSRVRYQIVNGGDRPLYFMLSGIDSSGHPVAFFPFSEAGGRAIAAGETLNLPLDPDIKGWEVGGATGLARVRLTCCTSPLEKTREALKSILRSPRDAKTLQVISDPLKVARSLLEDLNAASREAAETAGVAGDVYTLDTQVWATLNFAYRVV